MDRYKLFEKLNSLNTNQKLVLSLAVVINITFLGFQISSRATDEDVRPLDTYIPKGFQLVPVEIDNYEKLDSILGQFALVSLFEQNSKTALVSGIKLLRAPSDPRTFLVLTPEDQAWRILSARQPFKFAIQPQYSTGTKFEKLPSHKPKQRIWEIEI